MTGSPLLSVKGLGVSYGQLAAVRDVSISVARGAAVAIVGPNGAGKSTVLNAIAGGIRSAMGDVSLEGQKISRRRPEDIARMGISLVPEGRRVFATLTVEENLLVASGLQGSQVKAREEIAWIFQRFPRLDERRSQPAGKLSGGEQQMLAIARALMTNPKLLLVDEPSLGLAPKIVDEVYHLLLELKAERGLSLLINEQNSKRVLKFLDEIYVLREGATQLHGRCEDLRGDDAVADAYFGHGAFGANAQKGNVS